MDSEDVGSALTATFVALAVLYGLATRQLLVGGLLAATALVLLLCWRLVRAVERIADSVETQ